VKQYIYMSTGTASRLGPTKQKLLLGVFPAGFANFRSVIYNSTNCCACINRHFFLPYVIGKAYSTRSAGSEVRNFLARFLITCEIKCRIAMTKAAFNKKRALFTSTLDLE
jgi:hypothetical protein